MYFPARSPSAHDVFPRSTLQLRTLAQRNPAEAVLPEVLSVSLLEDGQNELRATLMLTV